MTKIIEDKIIHVETKDDREHYTFNFSMLKKLNEDDGSIYSGINVRDEIVQMISEQFRWAIIKYAHNLDMEKDEDALIFMQKIYPNSFKDMTLEEIKKLGIGDLT
jgi:hypothetical protein